jgi:signal transduction histidine kinase
LQARLPIEVSRLRLELSAALIDVRSSRARLSHATAEERRRLERDLHDGAQQQIVAAGMRLRSLQRRFDPISAEHRELDVAVDSLEATVAELRRLANGIRPSRLDDGLSTALNGLVADSPVSVTLSVAETWTSNVVATTVYFVVAEAYANALKHAGAETVTVEVAQDADTLRVEVADDGVGGVTADLLAVRDRVASVGGTVSVHSPPGGGTRIRVEIPDAHRRRR